MEQSSFIEGLVLEKIEFENLSSILITVWLITDWI